MSLGQRQDRRCSGWQQQRNQYRQEKLLRLRRVRLARSRLQQGRGLLKSHSRLFLEEKEEHQLLFFVGFIFCDFSYTMTVMKNRDNNRNNILSLGFVSFFNDLASEMIYPLLPLFLSVTLGAGPAILGLIEGIAEATASLINLFSGRLSDRLQVRKPIFTLGYSFSNLLRPLIGLAGTWPVLFILRFADRVGKGIRTSPRDALLSDSVPEASRGKAFGFQRGMDHAGAVVGPLAAALLLGPFAINIRTVFLLSAIPGLITVLIVILAVREVKPKYAKTQEEVTPGFAGFDKIFYLYLASIFIFTIGNSSDAFLLLRANDIGLATAMIPLLWSVLHVSKTIFSFLGGFAGDRFGHKAAIIIGWLVYALVYLGFGRVSSTAGIWGLFAIYGIYFGLTEAPQKAMIADLTPCELRGSGYGLFHLAVSIAAFPASLIFGGLWSLYGAQPAFYFGAGLAALASISLALIPSSNQDRAPRSEA